MLHKTHNSMEKNCQTLVSFFLLIKEDSYVCNKQMYSKMKHYHKDDVYNKVLDIFNLHFVFTIINIIITVTVPRSTRQTQTDLTVRTIIEWLQGKYSPSSNKGIFSIII